MLSVKPRITLTSQQVKNIIIFKLDDSHIKIKVKKQRGVTVYLNGDGMLYYILDKSKKIIKIMPNKKMSSSDVKTIWKRGIELRKSDSQTFKLDNMLYTISKNKVIDVNRVK